MSVQFQSIYLPMRDGEKIAIDVWTPDVSRHPLPTILRQTRYFRSIRLRRPFCWFNGNRPLDHTGLYAARRRRFLAAGYAWIDVDTRGSGASTGHRVCPWSPDEVADAGEVVDWIVRQPWSNGNVGALGISYDGTAAEMLLLAGRPAVKAIAPRFSCFDAFRDIGFINGVPSRWFTEKWGAMNAALDANRLQDIAGQWTRLVSPGVAHVDADTTREQVGQAIADHAANYEVHSDSLTMSFADQESEQTSDRVPPVHNSAGKQLTGTRAFSPSAWADEIASSGAAIYSIAGWWDGAYARAAAERFNTIQTNGRRLLLGPWNHGGGWHTDPADRARKNRFDHDGDLIRFFDAHLKLENSLTDAVPAVRYYTLIESAWKQAERWPPPNFSLTPMCVGAEGQLGPASKPALRNEPPQLLSMTIAKTGSGTQSRYRSQAGVDQKVCYPDRRETDAQAFVFDSSSLTKDLEMTGHPVADLYLGYTPASPTDDLSDASVMVYLEDVLPDGTVRMVTEGVFSLIHRKLTRPFDPSVDSDDSASLPIPQHSFVEDDAEPILTFGIDKDMMRVQFDLLPTSYLFRAGHQIRCSIVGADVDHFSSPPQGRAIHIGVSGTMQSQIGLPIGEECSQFFKA